MSNQKTFYKKLVTAIVLAGGQGRRVGGRDKGWISWEEKPLFMHAYDRILPQVNRVIVSCNRNIARYKEVVKIVIEDERNNYCGPLAGIEAAGKFVDTYYAVIIPCDAPLIPTDLVERLVSPLESEKNIEVSYVWDGFRPQFLFTAIKHKIMGTVTSCLNNGGRSMRDWHNYVETKPIDFSDKIECFKNINYNSQLAADEQT